MSIRRKQLVALFFCSLVPWIVGNGLIPLLPVYLTQLGANSAIAGYSLAFSYLAIALGALSAGWVSGSLHRRKLPLIIAGLAAIPTPWLMGQVSAVWDFTILIACLWFCGGLGFALISILAGLSSSEKERGKIFGILAVSSGLGALIGNLGSGWLVSGWGYAAFFHMLTICLVFWPLLALFLEEKEGKPAMAGKTPREKARNQALLGLGKGFYLLFIVSILISISGFFITLIRSILMDHLNFSPLEITSTSAIGSLIAMPLMLLMGWLSDRIGRKTLLLAGNLAILASLVLLAFSKTLWNFWTVFALHGLAAGGAGIGNAFVTDLVPKESLGKGLAIFGSAGWIGGMVGFAAAGTLLQNLGFGPTLIIGAGLVVIATGLLVPIQVRTREIEQPEPEPDPASA